MYLLSFLLICWCNSWCDYICMMLYFLSQARGICSIQPIYNFLVLNKSNNVHLLRNQCTCINNHFKHLALCSHDLCHFLNIFLRTTVRFFQGWKIFIFQSVVGIFHPSHINYTKKMFHILEIFRCFLVNIVVTIDGPLLFCGVGIFQHLFNILYNVIWWPNPSTTPRNYRNVQKATPGLFMIF